MVFWAKSINYRKQGFDGETKSATASRVGVYERGGVRLVLVLEARGPAGFGFLVRVRVNVSALIGSGQPCWPALSGRCMQV